MVNLKTEYTDAKQVHHQVEHIVSVEEDTPDREHLVEALVVALTKKGKQISA